MLKVDYNGEKINILIEYKKRKTVSIRIDYDLKVRVLAPKECNKDQVMNIIESKLDLISKKLNDIRSLSQRQEIEISNDEQLLYMGKKYYIKVILDKNIEKNNISIQNNNIIINTQNDEQEQVKNIIKKHFKKEGSKQIKKRVSYYQSNFKLKPKSINIVESEKFWGICSSNRDIKFNWKLIMAPIEVIDYVVVHEMSHMSHMNHSKSFWKMVAKIIPEYKKQVEWLQFNGRYMKI
ncbi:MAG: M48 family metallopeptidase [Tepidibacter sp.]|jgi:predicted metal-dependent hydrolase|uniref:M48 family metallopeptidase n=1 Tax=Tepidibacter sp. TaxID=2529387 RepID=UPI0025D93456|nr:SprT family zinc-dependent metalloprotease [Tepidibacter sp.]MCT4509842.1 M48 family metallopeptidase [Tepidibacter sp.]MCT4585880.1 M48 family metallopeptidase [Peptostreptococcaceae bacterium]